MITCSTVEKLNYSEEYVSRVVVGIWLLSLPLVLLLLFTPLEVTPIQLSNLPRWALWFLAFPATKWLKDNTGTFSWFWKPIPWLLWALFPLIQLLGTADRYIHRPELPWQSHVSLDITCEVLHYVFAQQLLHNPIHLRWYDWHTGTIEYHWGNKVVARQMLITNGGAWARRVAIRPIIPSLQWCTPIPDDSIFRAPWQPIDTATVQMK